MAALEVNGLCGQIGLAFDCVRVNHLLMLFTMLRSFRPCRFIRISACSGMPLLVVYALTSWNLQPGWYGVLLGCFSQSWLEDLVPGLISETDFFHAIESPRRASSRK